MTLLTRLSIVALLAAAPLCGASLEVELPGAHVAGPAGGIVMWALKVANHGQFMVPTSLSYQTLQPVGTLTDPFAALFVVLGAGQSATVAAYYEIDTAAPPGYVSMGQLALTYDLFGVDPSNPAFDPDTDLLSGGIVLAVDVSVTVEGTEIPEPGTWGLLAWGLAALGVRRRGAGAARRS
jgi:uncharacterized protein (TIGR03382 family)